MNYRDQNVRKIIEKQLYNRSNSPAVRHGISSTFKALTGWKETDTKIIVSLDIRQHILVER
jgi:hypothetical protein